jgi:hypothetical protein
VRGFSEDCAKADDVTGTTQHPFRDWITGVYKRHVLLLRMCIACETVEVRDRTRSMEAVVGSQSGTPPTHCSAGTRALARASASITRKGIEPWQ